MTQWLKMGSAIVFQPCSHLVFPSQSRISISGGPNSVRFGSKSWVSSTISAKVSSHKLDILLSSYTCVITVLIALVLSFPGFS